MNKHSNSGRSAGSLDLGDQWIGWSEERRRLPLAVNKCRFLLHPDKTFPKALIASELVLTLSPP